MATFDNNPSSPETVVPAALRGDTATPTQHEPATLSERFNQRTDHLLGRLSEELQPCGALQEIAIQALARSAAGMELGSDAESAALDFSSRNAAVLELVTAASPAESVLVNAMLSDHVSRASRFRATNQRAFFSAVKSWQGLCRHGHRPQPLSLFASEDRCVEYLATWQLDQPWRCEACGDSRRWLLRTAPKFECPCGRQHSVREDTLFARSHTPLLAWFQVVAAVMLEPQLRAADISDQIPVVRRATLRKLIEKVRQALQDPASEQLLAGLPAYVAHHLHQVPLASPQRSAQRAPPTRLANPTTPSHLPDHAPHPAALRRPR